jgi:hypothetical protein
MGQITIAEACASAFRAGRPDPNSEMLTVDTVRDSHYIALQSFA